MNRKHLDLVDKLEFANIEFLKALYGCQTLRLKGAWLLFNDILPETFCNLVMAVRTTQKDIPHLLSVIERYFKGRSTRAALQVTPATKPRNFAKFLISHGFKKAYSESWMIHNKKIKTQELKELEVVGVKTTGQMRMFIELFNSFGNNLPKSENLDRAYKSVLWDSFKKRQPKTKVKHYLASLNQKPVGFGTLVVAKNYASIYNVGVLESFRGRGMGSILVNELIIDARRAKVKEIFLQTSRNSPAQKFFKKRGFKEVFTANVFEKT